MMLRVPLVALVPAGLALALGGGSAVAGDPDVSFVTDVPTARGGAFVLPWQVWTRGTVPPTVPLDFGSPNAVDGVHRMAGGDWLVTFAATTVLGADVYDPADIVRIGPGGARSLFFDSSAFGLPPGSNVDAVFLDGGDAGDLVLSFETPVTFGAVTYAPADLVRRLGPALVLDFDASATTPPLPASANVVGAHRSGSGTLLAFGDPVTLGPVTYRAGDVVRWDGAAFSSFSSEPDWPAGSRIVGLALAESCADGDGDGFGAPGSLGCPGGLETDCADAAPTRYPGAPERCNGVDDNCDGVVDEDTSGTMAGGGTWVHTCRWFRRPAARGSASPPTKRPARP